MKLALMSNLVWRLDLVELQVSLQVIQGFACLKDLDFDVAKILIEWLRMARLGNWQDFCDFGKLLYPLALQLIQQIMRHWSVMNYSLRNRFGWENLREIEERRMLESRKLTKLELVKERIRAVKRFRTKTERLSWESRFKQFLVHQEAFLKLLVLKLCTVLNAGDGCTCDWEVLGSQSPVSDLFWFKADVPKDLVVWALLWSFVDDVGYLNLPDPRECVSQLGVCRVLWDAADENFFVDLQLGLIKELVFWGHKLFALNISAREIVGFVG